jgi:hypothetical protein
VEARDFALWLKTSKKPPRQRRPDAPAPGSVITGAIKWSDAIFASVQVRRVRAHTLWLSP